MDWFQRCTKKKALHKDLEKDKNIDLKKITPVHSTKWFQLALFCWPSCSFSVSTSAAIQLLFVPGNIQLSGELSCYSWTQYCILIENHRVVFPFLGFSWPMYLIPTFDRVSRCGRCGDTDWIRTWTHMVISSTNLLGDLEAWGLVSFQINTSFHLLRCFLISDSFRGRKCLTRKKQTTLSYFFTISRKKSP